MKKMKTLLVVVLGLSLVTILPSCEKLVGKGPEVTEDRTLPAFQLLSYDVPAECYFVQGPHFSAQLTGQQNILDEIETVMINNEMRVRFRHPNISVRTNERIVVRVEAPTLTSLAVNGSGFLQLDTLTTTTFLKLYIGGSGAIRAEEINARFINATIDGSGNMYVYTGHATQDIATVSGSGYIDLAGVEVTDADTRISGSGTIAVNAEKTLKAQISGSGTVFYYGNPVITKNISGSGRVVKL